LSAPFVVPVNGSYVPAGPARASPPHKAFGRNRRSLRPEPNPFPIASERGFNPSFDVIFSQNPRSLCGSCSCARARPFYFAPASPSCVDASKFSRSSLGIVASGRLQSSAILIEPGQSCVDLRRDGLRQHQATGSPRRRPFSRFAPRRRARKRAGPRLSQRAPRPQASRQQASGPIRPAPTTSYLWSWVRNGRPTPVSGFLPS
jgi:hypothetical protein